MNEEETEKAIDKKAIDLMLTSKTIEEWNENRDTVKTLRDQSWVSKNIDQSGLVFKALPNKKVGDNPTSNRSQSNG
jgi:hypothetical protein